MTQPRGACVRQSQELCSLNAAFHLMVNFLLFLSRLPYISPPEPRPVLLSSSQQQAGPPERAQEFRLPAD